MKSSQHYCPLCNDDQSQHYHQDRYRNYHLCPSCGLIYVPPNERPDVLSEKAQYDLHDNRSEEENYHSILSRMVDPLLAKIEPGAIGLDFGSGPDPLLASMLRQAGMKVRTYDVFYDPDASVWYQDYDFIACSEVVEYLHNPGREFTRLFAALKPGGWLGLITRRVVDHKTFGIEYTDRNFAQVCFYSTNSLEWVANQNNADLELLGNDIALLHKRQK